MTQDEMNALVPKKLAEMELQHDMKVLLAVEAGSRAWGFASPDSDFDVRFIYVRRPEHYLRLDSVRDVIEEPRNEIWDVNGWDLDKALQLLYKSNPALYEWMNSPIQYRITDFAERFRPLMEVYFSPKSMMYHYLSMAKKNFHAYLLGEEVRPKKYFYVLRPLLACRWVAETKTPPPMLFSELASAFLPEEYRDAVDSLLDLKMNGPEMMTIAPIPTLQRYLEDGIDEFDRILNAWPREKRLSWEPLNEFFLSMVQK